MSCVSGVFIIHDQIDSKTVNLPMIYIISDVRYGGYRQVFQDEKKSSLSR